MERITARRPIGQIANENQATGKTMLSNISAPVARRALGEVGNQQIRPPKTAIATKTKPSKLQDSTTTTKTLVGHLEPLAIANRKIPAKPKAAKTDIACIKQGFINIDLEDDPQLVSHYVQDIIIYLKQLEVKYPINKNYMQAKHQTTKSMRALLINWMVEVCASYKFVKETFYQSVGLLDRYLQVKPEVGRKTLQLVGCCCMFLASKYEEKAPPDVSDFVYVGDDSFTRAQMFHVEQDVLKTVDFALGRPTSIMFLRRYSKVNQSHPKAHTLAKYFMELLQLETDLCHVFPSMQAAAACCLCLSLVHDVTPAKAWSEPLALYSGYKLDDFLWLVHEMAQLAVNAPFSQYKQIYNLYSEANAMSVSKDRKLNGEHLKQIAEGATIIPRLKKI